MHKNPTSKWAIITGATAGIGWATAEELAQAGFSLILIGRRSDRLKELRDRLVKSSSQNDRNQQFKTVQLDVTKKSQVDDFVQAEGSSLENVTVLVNNAGLAKGSDKVQSAQLSDWDAMIDTNVKGLLYLTRAVLPYMVKNKSGHIVNLGSVAGRLVYPGGAVYCATKFAVRAISEGLRMDLAGSNIRVTNIEPGMVNSEFSLVRFGDQEKADKVYEGMTPLTPKDIAETILWCVQRPSHVNIQELVIYPTDQATIGQVNRK
ncbi:SDR family NAD(P)-dependent oxidoreductase [Bdellovibrio sp. HCB337]|uniref:SDR family NAD(P)-dependent oxidoreductase n=1 Tax=Bdellovibrio sp. HCB337 TaxID=3394358 RepID=UPI0039A5B881